MRRNVNWILANGCKTIRVPEQFVSEVQLENAVSKALELKKLGHPEALLYAERVLISASASVFCNSLSAEEAKIASSLLQ